MKEKMSKMGSYRRLLKYIWPYRKRVAMAMLCMILVAASNLVVPWIIKDVVDKVLADKDLNMLHMIIGIILLVFLSAALLHSVRDT